MISIDSGEYKGLKGRVLLANETNVMVEIPSKNQKVTLLRTQISEPNNEETTYGVDASGGGGDGWGEPAGNKTPSYLPSEGNAQWGSGPESNAQEAATGDWGA